MLFTLILVACESHKTQQMQLDIRSVIDHNEAVVLLSDMATAIKYIPLETNGNCLLTSVYNVRQSNVYLFVADTHHLFQFDKEGRFIRQIGRLGNGPGELGRRIRFDINEDAKQIYIHTRKTLVNVYDMHSGEYQRCFNTNKNINQIVSLSNGQLATFNYDMPVADIGENMFEAYLFNQKGQRIDSIADYTRLNKIANASNYINVYCYNKNVVYKSYYKDTLYRINSQFEKEPYLLFKLDNPYQVPFKKEVDFSDETTYPELISVYKTRESHNALFLTVEKGLKHGRNRDMRRIYYQKESRELKRVTAITNDLDGGPDFWPRFQEEGCLITSFEAFELLLYYNQTKSVKRFSEAFVNMVKVLNVNSNPVLMLVEEK